MNNRMVKVLCHAEDLKDVEQLLILKDKLEGALSSAETPEQIVKGKQLLDDINYALSPRRGIYHWVDCFVPDQITNRDGPWIVIPLSDLPKSGMRLCQANGGCSG